MSGALGPIGDARVEVHVDFASLQRDLARAEQMVRASMARMEALQVRLRTTLGPAAGAAGFAPAAAATAASAAVPAAAVEASARRANAELAIMRERTAAVGRQVQASLQPAAPIVRNVAEAAAGASEALTATGAAATATGAAVAGAVTPATDAATRMRSEFSDLRGRIAALAPAAARSRSASGALMVGVRGIARMAGPLGPLATIFGVQLVGGLAVSAIRAAKLRQEIEEIDRKARIAAGSLEDLANVLTSEDLAALSINLTRQKNLARRTAEGEFRDTSVTDVSRELGLPPVVRLPEQQQEAARQLRALEGRGVRIPAKVEVDLGDLGTEGDVTERIRRLLEEGTKKGAKRAEPSIRETLSRLQELLGELRFEAAALVGTPVEQQGLAPALGAIRDFQRRNAALAEVLADRIQELRQTGLGLVEATRQANAEIAAGFRDSSEILRADLARLSTENLARYGKARDDVLRQVLQGEASITKDREEQTRARIQLIELESATQSQALAQLRAEIEASYLPAAERAQLLTDLDGLIVRLETLKEQQVAQVGREGTFLGQIQLQLEQFPTVAELATSAIDRFGTAGFNALVDFAAGSESAGEAFARFGESLLREVGAMILKLLILRALMAAVGALGGGGGAGVGGGIFGANNSAGGGLGLGGGTVAHARGRLLAGRMALVGGPGAEELFVPATGGHIIPPDVLRALGMPRSGGATAPRIVVNDFSGERIEVRPGRRETEITVGRMVASDLRRGGEAARALTERGVRFTPRGR